MTTQEPRAAGSARRRRRTPSRTQLLTRVVARHAERFQPAAPPYLPALWNRPDRQRRSNCLAYAIDGRTPVWRDPEGTTAAEIAASLRRIGLRPAKLKSLMRQPGRRHLVAVFVSPPAGAGVAYMDFHCYRLDRDGRWSHKPGPLAVTRDDMGGKPIVVPWDAEHPFLVTDFLGLYWVG